MQTASRRIYDRTTAPTPWRRGEAAWYNRVADRATTLYPRLQRPRGERFSESDEWTRLQLREVGDLLDRIAAYFDEAEELTANEIRTATFRPKNAAKACAGGTVDAPARNRAIEILLAVD